MVVRNRRWFAIRRKTILFKQQRACTNLNHLSNFGDVFVIVVVRTCLNRLNLYIAVPRSGLVVGQRGARCYGKCCSRSKPRYLTHAGEFEAFSCMNH